MERLTDSAYYAWDVPFKPVAVYLSHKAVNAILRQAAGGRWRRRREVGGLLLGRAETGPVATVYVEDVVAVPIEYAFGPFYAFSENDREYFRETLREWAPRAKRELRAVGFYRTQTRGGLALSQHDLSVFMNYFSDPSNVALLVKRRTIRASVAGFFIWEEGQIRAGSSHLEFRIRTHKHVASPESQPEPAPAAEPAGAEAEGGVPLPSFLSVSPEKEKKRKWWKGREKEKETETKPARPRPPLWTSWWVQLPILGCLLAVDALLGFVSARQVRPPPPRSAAAARDPFALSLLVVEYGENLSLTWDRNAVAIAQAERAVLTINDGGNTVSLDLELPVLRNPGFGVTYHRVTEQLRFRLEVFLKNRRSVSETWEMGANGAPRQADGAKPARQGP